MPAHDRLTRLDIAQLPAFGLAARGDDDRIHPLLLDFDPLALEANVRAVVGRRIEVVGHAAVLFRRFHEHVAFAFRVAAERGQLLQQVIEHRLLGGRDAHLELRDVVIGPADIELEDLVGGLVLDDLVEDRRQET